MKEIYDKAKAFLEQFDDLQDYVTISKKLEEICFCILKKQKINKHIEIVFEDNKAFGNYATEYPDKISFNKLKFDTMNVLKIDCFSENHMEKIYDFYNNYDGCKTTNKFEDCLYNFMKKYISLGYEDYFRQMGSFKAIKYDLLETLFHETQHLVQEEYKKLIYENNINILSENVLLTFTILFNHLYAKLLENNIDFEYKRENYSFPIEFDARYIALVMIENLRMEYFITDKLFIQNILNNDILPKNNSSKELAEKIYDDFKNVYKIYNLNIATDYDGIYSIINKHEKKIKFQLAKRYEEMDKIYNNLKIELTKE